MSKILTNCHVSFSKEDPQGYRHMYKWIKVYLQREFNKIKYNKDTLTKTDDLYISGLQQRITDQNDVEKTDGRFYNIQNFIIKIRKKLEMIQTTMEPNLKAPYWKENNTKEILKGT